MPKIDFSNQQIPQGYKLPEPEIQLTDDMEPKQLAEWIYQELYKIYNSKGSNLIKEMKKEDIYDKLIKRNYNLEELFDDF